MTTVTAVFLMIIITLAGASFDMLTGTGLRRVFGVSLVIAATFAAISVRRTGLWAIVIAPPLLYLAMCFVGALGGDVAAFQSQAEFGSTFIRWLIDGFPEIATSMAIAFVIAFLRGLHARRSNPARARRT